VQLQGGVYQDYGDAFQLNYINGSLNNTSTDTKYPIPIMYGYNTGSASTNNININGNLIANSTCLSSKTAYPVISSINPNTLYSTNFSPPFTGASIITISWNWNGYSTMPSQIDIWYMFATYWSPYINIAPRPNNDNMSPNTTYYGTNNNGALGICIPSSEDYTFQLNNTSNTTIYNVSIYATQLCGL
jgi:hypothetical protein